MYRSSRGFWETREEEQFCLPIRRRYTGMKQGIRGSWRMWIPERIWLPEAGNKKNRLSKP